MERGLSPQRLIAEHWLSLWCASHHRNVRFPPKPDLSHSNPRTGIGPATKQTARIIVIWYNVSETRLCTLGGCLGWLMETLAT